jgi:hypothetical protein
MVSAKTANGESFNQFSNNQYAVFGAFTFENLHGTGNTTQGSEGITGLPRSLIDELMRPGAKFYVTAEDYKGAPVFTASPATFVRKIEGDTVFLTGAALLSGAHTIKFHDASLTNRQREIDALEVSQFGGFALPNNAQFALQPTQASDGGDPANVHGFKLNDGGAITTLMVWKGPRTPVEFRLYYGNYTSISELKGMKPAFEYTTPATQDKYVPNSEQQTFHLNLWQFNYNGQQPQPSPTEVIVTKFQYEPL